VWLRIQLNDSIDKSTVTDSFCKLRDNVQAMIIAIFIELEFSKTIYT
jgi:hypothetical protein